MEAIGRHLTRAPRRTMNTRTKALLLLSSVALCAFLDAPTRCEAVPAHAAAPGATAVDEVRGAPRLFERDVVDDVVSIVENFATDLTRALENDPSGIGRFILDKIRLAYRTLTSLYNRLGPQATISNFLDLRNRRSLPEMSDVSALNPFSVLARTMRSVRDVAEERLGNVSAALTNLGLDFLTTTALPWLRETVDAMAKTPDLPSPLRALIDDFDAFYGLLRLLGFVGSSAAG